jgi:hypothetical protein
VNRSFKDVITARHTKILSEAVSDYSDDTDTAWISIAALREIAYSYNVLLSLGHTIELRDEVMAELILRKLV